VCSIRARRSSPLLVPPCAYLELLPSFHCLRVLGSQGLLRDAVGHPLRSQHALRLVDVVPGEFGDTVRCWTGGQRTASRPRNLPHSRRFPRELNGSPDLFHIMCASARSTQYDVTVGQSGRTKRQARTNPKEDGTSTWEDMFAQSISEVTWSTRTITRGWLALIAALSEGGVFRVELISFATSHHGPA
jgi:hypothetical protein